MEILKAPPAAKYPVNKDVPLRPTKAVYLQSGSEFARVITITDVSDSFATLGDIASLGKSSNVVETAKAGVVDRPTLLEVRRAGRFSTSRDVVDPTGGAIASLSCPIWSLGRWTLEFPAGSPHSEHAIILKPAGMASREDMFVKDSIPYFWDVQLDEGKTCKLYKAAGGERIEIGRFLTKSARDRDGVLLLDDSQIGEVVGYLTCVAMLNRLDSFRA
jgi:hypothetical protein